MLCHVGHDDQSFEDFDSIEEVVQENTRMKDEEMPEADALIISNCGRRLITFGPELAVKWSISQHVLRDIFPMKL